MLSKALERLLLTENWLKTETRIHGEYRGYWINAAGEKGLTSIETVYPFTPEQLRELKPRLETLKLPKRKTEIVANERSLALYVIGKADLSHTELKYALNHFCDALVQVGIPEETGCGSCGRLGSYPLAELGPEKTFPMCEACYAQGEADLALAQQRLKTANFKYLRGTIGAIIGGMIMGIPWLLLDQIGFMGAFFAYFIGKGAFRGYLMTGGQIGPLTAKILVAVTGCIVVTTRIASLGLTLEHPAGWYSISFIRHLVTEPSLAGAVWTGLALALFAAGIGIQQLILDIKAGTTVPVLTRLKQ